jgi:hypothetical protein
MEHEFHLMFDDRRRQKSGKSMDLERQMTARPRYAAQIEQVHFDLPAGKKLGGVIAVDFAPDGDLFVLHQWNPPGVDTGELRADEFLPDVARFGPDGAYKGGWGGPDHIPAADGEQQWPKGREGLEIDGEGNVWIFGYSSGDDAVLKFDLDGNLRMRIGQRGKPGTDASTDLLHGPTSCYHDLAAREVFVTDGYGNHRVIAFNSDTGKFTRMWGAFGNDPSSIPEGEGFGNPVHKIACGPDGRLYVCDRINNRIQEFERVDGGARFLRELSVAPGTGYWGSAFDMAFVPDGRHIVVADGSNLRMWFVDIDSFEVVGWASADNDTEGDGNAPRHFGLVHRFRQAPNGDLLLCRTSRGVKRMKYLGTY